MYDFRHLQAEAHENAIRKGFWADYPERDVKTGLVKLALVTSEIGEAVEALRKNDPTNFAEELADIVIRIMDLAGGFRMNLEQAITEKMEKNRERPPMHGKLA